MYTTIASSMSLITPQIDLAFKKIFGVKENKHLLISLGPYSMQQFPL